MKPINTAALALATFGCVLFAGCVGGKEMKAGRSAEKRGNHAGAYDHYIRAAYKNPSSGRVAGALRRVAPKAVAQWKREAERAVERGRHADAWRMAMRGLDIQPNDLWLYQFIRELESKRGREVAAARREWLRRGRAALAITPARRDTPATNTDNLDGEHLSEAERTLATARTGIPTPLHDDAPALAQTPERSTGADAPSVAGPTAGGPAAALADALSNHPSATPSGDSRRPGRIVSPSSTTYLAVHLLSRDDDRIAREVKTIDGLSIKLKDTDDGPRADFNVYVNDKRVAKARDVRVGQGVLIRGRSGRRLRITVLNIEREMETVRFGVLPGR